MTQQQPNTKWVVKLVPNVPFHIYKMIGMAQIEEPDGGRLTRYIVENRAVVVMERSQRDGSRLFDNSCFCDVWQFFQTVSVHQSKSASVIGYVKVGYNLFIKTLYLTCFPLTVEKVRVVMGSDLVT